VDARLTFENQSLDVSQTEIVLFQRDRRHRQELPVVWKVIRRCGTQCTHPFRFPTAVDLEVYDAWGNRIAHRPLRPRMHLWIKPNARGGSKLSNEPSSHGQIGFTNSLPQGALEVFLSRDGRAVTPRRTLAPGLSTLFDLDLKLHFVPWDGLSVGDPVPPEALISGRGPDNVVDLLGVSSARILMLGGGCGALAQRLRFHPHEVHRTNLD